MPLFDVETPTGQTIKVWAKDGASDSEIIANAIKQQNMEQYSPVEGQSGMSNFMAGMGKSLYDTGRGIKQLAGAEGMDQTIAESRKYDAPLMGTGSGMAGNIAGHVGMTLAPGGMLGAAGKMAGLPAYAQAGKALLAPRTLAGSGLLGGAYSGIQPVAEDESRLMNTGLGAAAGVGGQLAGRAIGGAWQGAKALTEPFRQSGRERLVGRTLSRYAGNPERAQANMAAATEIVPGSKPTMAQAADDAGISQLERTIKDIDPAIGSRLTDTYNSQNAARMAVLRGLAGDSEKMAAAKLERAKEALPYLKVLSNATEEVDPTPTIKLIDKMRLGRGGKRQALKSTLDSIRKNIVSDDDLGVMVKDPDLLYGVRQDIADKLNAKAVDGSKINDAIARELTTIMHSIDNQIRKVVPEYGQYLKAYAEKSKPIDQMKVGMALIKKATSALAKSGDEVTLHPEAYARALRDGADLIKKATGFKRGSLEKLLTKDQLSALKAVGVDLERSVKGQGAGRAYGSNTLQNMSSKNILRQVLGPTGLPESWTEAGALNAIMRPADFIYGGMQPAINDLMLEAAQNPQLAARLMQQGQKQWLSPATLGLLRGASVSGPVGLLNSVPQ